MKAILKTFSVVLPLAAVIFAVEQWLYEKGTSHIVTTFFATMFVALSILLILAVIGGIMELYFFFDND